MKKESPISLTAKLATSEIYTGTPIWIEVVLKNISHSSIIVNKRMSVGYKNSLSRELYADLRFANDNKQQVPYYESDIDRDFSPASDYVTLKAGESLSEIINLMEFYAPNGPGKYELVLYYQADEEMALFPKNVLRNIYSSNTISFEVLPKMVEAEK